MNNDAREPYVNESDAVCIQIPKCYICSQIEDKTVMVGIDPCEHTLLGRSFAVVPRREWERVSMEAHTISGFASSMEKRHDKTYARANEERPLS